MDVEIDKNAHPLRKLLFVYEGILQQTKQWQQTTQWQQKNIKTVQPTKLNLKSNSKTETKTPQKRKNWQFYKEMAILIIIFCKP